MTELTVNMTESVSNHSTAATESNITCYHAECVSNAVMLSAEWLTIVLGGCGFVGNLLTVLAIMTSRLSCNINSILIGHLSTAQIVYCGAVLPLQALVFHTRGWPLHHSVCIFNSAVRIWLIGVNMMLLSAIALYRFLHIVHPQAYAKISSRGPFVGIIVLCWLFSLFFSLTPVFDLWGSFSFHPTILQCTFTQSEHKSHKVTTITLGFVIPCIFIVVCYARIGCVAYLSRKRVARTASQYRKHKSQKDSLRLTAMMLCIFCLFLIGTTPYFAVNILDPNFKRPMAHIWAPFMAWFMYCMNPVVYTIMDQSFQMAFRRLLTCQVCTTGTQHSCVAGNSSIGEVSHTQH